jgi:inosine triphosphate pyrophosphatase
MYFITSNQNKFNETKDILGIDLEMLSIDLPEIQNIDPIVVAQYKANEAKKLGYDNFIVEDSGLYITSKKEIGALVKWFPVNRLVMAYFLDEAYAVSVLVLCQNGVMRTIHSSVYGKIVFPRGKNGFGWDSIFEFEGETFAEMAPEKKNKISPRYKALMKLKKSFL